MSDEHEDWIKDVEKIFEEDKKRIDLAVASIDVKSILFRLSEGKYHHAKGLIDLNYRVEDLEGKMEYVLERLNKIETHLGL